MLEITKAKLLRFNNLKNNFKRGFLASFFMIKNQFLGFIHQITIRAKLYLFERAVKSKKWLNFTLKIV